VAFFTLILGSKFHCLRASLSSLNTGKQEKWTRQLQRNSIAHVHSQTSLICRLQASSDASTCSRRGRLHWFLNPLADIDSWVVKPWTTRIYLKGHIVVEWDEWELLRWFLEASRTRFFCWLCRVSFCFYCLLRVCTYILKTVWPFLVVPCFSPPAECFSRIAVVHGMYIYYVHMLSLPLLDFFPLLCN